MIKKLAVALTVTLVCGSPAMAAYVVPYLGEVQNIVYVSEGAALDPGRRSGGGNDGGQWLTVPTTLSTSAAGFLFGSEGGFAGADQQMDAVWSSPDAGTISIDFEALLAAPGAFLLATNEVPALEDRASRWKYNFEANEDSLLTFNIETYNDYDGADRDEIMFNNYGILTLTKYLPQMDVPYGSASHSNILNNTTKSQTLTLQIYAGDQYTIEYVPTFFSLGRNYPGTTLFQASQEISWSIGARAVEPPDIDPGPGSAAPEPATWAMMIMGFGLAGAALRRQTPATPHPSGA